MREHQRQQQRLARLQGEVEKKDRVVEELASQLRRVQAILQRVIDSTSVKLVAKGDALSQDHAVDVDEVVAYAHKVSYTTSAPPNWNPNLPHMRMFQPPAPQEINILQGNYYHNTTNVPIPGRWHPGGVRVRPLTCVIVATMDQITRAWPARVRCAAGPSVLPKPLQAPRRD